MGIINNITMLGPIKGMQMLDRASVGILFSLKHAKWPVAQLRTLWCYLSETI
jgi:hypothetical protein